METDVVDKHLTLCDSLLSLLKEENRLLRKEPAQIEEGILDQKRDLLPQFDQSLEALRSFQETSPELLPAVREKLKSAQNLIMRILLLDRENEQLLLKTLLPKVQTQSSRRSLQSIKGIYEKHRIPETD